MDNVEYTYSRRLGISNEEIFQDEEDSYVSDEEEVLRMQSSLKNLSMPEWVPIEDQGASMSLIASAIETRTVKFMKRPFGFSIEQHPVLDYALVTNITNSKLKDLADMAILKIADRITSGISVKELVHFLKMSPLPVEITFGEFTMPNRKSTQKFYSTLIRIEHSEEAENKLGFLPEKTDSDVKASSKASPCLRPTLINKVSRGSQLNMTPRLNKLIHESPEYTSLIERVSGLNLTRASTVPDEFTNAKKKNKNKSVHTVRKHTTRVSYLHDVLKCDSTEYEFIFHEDEKGVSDSDGTSDEEEHISWHYVVNSGPIHLTRSVTYDEAQAKRVFDMYEYIDILSHHNPATYRDLSMKGIEGKMERWSKMCVKRVNILQELYDTEQTFLMGIEKLYHEFLKPVSECFVLKQEEKLTLLNYIPQIIEISRFLLEEFKKSDNIAKTFLKEGQCLRIYSKFVMNYSKMCVLVRDLEKHKRFKRYCKRNEIPSKIFYSNCILPVQRGPRYNLLLKELRKYTQSDHLMVNDLDKAIAFTEDVCRVINKHGTIIENQHHLFRISSTIKEKSLKENGIWPLVQPSRILVREGTVLCYESALKKKDHKKENISNVQLLKTKGVLCNDMLLIISKQNVKRLMKLDYMREFQIEINHNGKKYFGVHITDTKDEFLIFYVHQRQDRDAWSESIRKYILLEQEIKNKSLPLVFQV